MARVHALHTFFKWNEDYTYTAHYYESQTAQNYSRLLLTYRVPSDRATNLNLTLYACIRSSMKHT